MFSEGNYLQKNVKKLDLFLTSVKFFRLFSSQIATEKKMDLSNFPNNIFSGRLKIDMKESIDIVYRVYYSQHISFLGNFQHVVRYSLCLKWTCEIYIYFQKYSCLWKDGYFYRPKTLFHWIPLTYTLNYYERIRAQRVLNVLIPMKRYFLAKL